MVDASARECRISNRRRVRRLGSGRRRREQRARAGGALADDERLRRRTAANADEALSQVARRAPAVALCDIRMPGHDGLWLAQQIRHDAPETAVIMATGVQDVGSAVPSLRQGVIDYLTKPFGRDRLRESVMRGIEWHKAARESRRWRETLEGEVETPAAASERRARGADASTTTTALGLDAVDVDAEPTPTPTRTPIASPRWR